jgi:excisionase family DNA binding protein
MTDFRNTAAAPEAVSMTDAMSTHDAASSNQTRRLLYTPVEAARALGIGRSTLYTLLGQGRIRSVRVGGLRRIPIEELHDFVAALERDRPGFRPSRFVESVDRESSTGSTTTLQD